MYVYDRARLLAQDLKESEEFRAYKALKDEAYKDDTTRTLLKQYKKLQFQYQTKQLSGAAPDAATTEQLKKYAELLSFNDKAAQYLAAEYRLQVIVNDIYKLIGDACEMDLDIF